MFPAGLRDVKFLKHYENSGPEKNRVDPISPRPIGQRLPIASKVLRNSGFILAYKRLRGEMSIDLVVRDRFCISFEQLSAAATH